MIQVKNRAYFISELLVKSVFTENDRYFVKLTTDEIQEIDENTYYNLERVVRKNNDNLMGVNNNE